MIDYLVGGIPTPLKNNGVRQIGSSSQLLGKITAMFQTTNQLWMINPMFDSIHWVVFQCCGV
jgi:hypothetical protein